MTTLPLYELESRLLAAHEEMSEAMERGEEVPASTLAVVEEYALAVGEKRDACAAVIRRLESEAEYVDGEIKRLTLIKARREAAAERLRGYVLSIMRAHNLEKVKGVTTTFTVMQNQPSVEVGLPAEALPAEYQRAIPAKVEPDKLAIKAALNSGTEITGCRLKPGDYRLKVS